MTSKSGFGGPTESPAHIPGTFVQVDGGPSADGLVGAGRSSGPGSGPGRPERAEPAAPTSAELQRVRAREPEALAAFFDRNFDPIYGLLFRLLGDRSAAEDAAQDVFLKVHRAVHRLDPERDPGPWLRAIAHNVCRDVWRSGAYRMARHSASLEDEPAAALHLADGSRNPEDRLLEAEREQLVQAALDRLPGPYREAVVLHDYQDLSHEEIAVLLGLKPAAVRKRYSRALTALAALLKDTLA